MRSQSDSSPRAAVWVEPSLHLAVFAAVSATVLFVALNALEPAGVDARFPIVLWSWVTAYSLALLVPLPIAAALCARRRSLAWLPLAVLAAEAAWLLFALLWLNRTALPALANLAGVERFRWLAPAAFAAAVAGIAAVPLLHRRRGPVRILFVGLLALTATALFPSSPKRASTEAAATVPAPAKERERVLLIGLDGGDWKYMEPLIARGLLPNLARLRDGGAWGSLETVVPTRSPLIWTTIATGRNADDHGIRRFKRTRIVGLHRELNEIQSPRGLFAEGFHRMLRVTGRIFDTTVTSADRRVPAYWQIASSFGLPVSIINWWATWPAEPTLGAIVSERIHFGRLQARGQAVVSERLTYPEELYESIRPLVVAPEAVTYENAREFLDIEPADFDRMRGTDFRHHVLEGEFKYIYSMFETDRRIALAFLERSEKRPGPADDLWVLFRIVDLACHSALQYSTLVDDHLDATPEELAKYGRMVTEAYRHADRAIGELIDAFGPGNVIIVSDHGFELGMGRNGEKRYVHNKAPAGIFIASGPAFRPGRVEGLSIREIFPLVLYLKDLPVAEDFAGRVPLEVVSETFVAAHPMLRIASYGRNDGSTAEILPSESDEVMLERLRALGYIQ